MTGKRKRKRTPKSGYRAPAPVVVQPERKRSEVPPFLSFLSRPTGDTPFPNIRTSLLRGFVTVGSSPALLAGPFVLLLASWLGLVALGLEGPPGRLVDLMAIPPVSTYFDALNGVAVYGFGSGGFLAATGFLAVRAVFLSALTGMIIESLEGGDSSLASVLEGVKRGLRAFPIVLAVNVFGLSLMVAGSIILPLLGPGLGFLGSVMTLVAALFFFVFAPAAAIREGRGLRETLRRSARAALVPGSRHLLMSMLYLFLSLPILVALAPGGSRLTVNPSFAMWAYALVTTFVHMGFLAAFCFRWVSVESAVPEQPVRRRR